MKTTAIAEMNNRTIVKLEKAGRIEWVVASNFDDNRPEGSKWDFGIYCSSLEKAVCTACRLDDMILLTMQADNANAHPVFTILRTREDAYAKINDFMEEHRMEWDSDKEVQDLKNYDYTTVGTYGFFQIEYYTFGDEIDRGED